MDPQSPDYWFNLSVSERRRKNYTAALNAVARCLALHPQDEEAQNLRKNLTMLKNGTLAVSAPPSAAVQTSASAEATSDETSSDNADDQADSSSVAKDKPDTVNANGASGSPSAQAIPDAASPDYEPLERVARTYDESSLRQGAFALEQMNAMKLRSMPPAQRAQRLCQQGRTYVNDGLLLEAERQFQLALAADPSSAAAYAGLAEVHEYAGSTKIAQMEANKSLQSKPNASAYLVLARIDLSQHALADARNNIDNALRLEPNNTAAKGILQAIQAQQGQQ
jgi:tetratricopeptide (TPR) repeat protein